MGEKMRGILFYVSAGKGHYTPAKALEESLSMMGHQIILEDLLLAIGARFWHMIVHKEWRFMLSYPNLERKMHAKGDQPKVWEKIIPLIIFFYRAKFIKWIKKVNPDFILTTHFFGGMLVPRLIKACGLDIPVYLYAADVFMSPLCGISNELDKLYISSQSGFDWVVQHGQDPRRTALCPFPLRHRFSRLTPMNKFEARKKLGLSHKFTVLLTLGGEGIGSTSFIQELYHRKLDIQVVIAGNISKLTKRKYDRFITLHPTVDVRIVGFVHNIDDYYLAADMVIGKQGANTLLECIYLHRPCIISNSLYTAECSADYIREHKIGWREDNPREQVRIVEECLNDLQFEIEMEKRFDMVDITFSADAFAKQIIEDTLSLNKYQRQSQSEI